jgi:pyruvate ferredoxin oxidoreductase gamma subunit
VFQVRIHGRGGQGVVTAAEMLSVAAFLDNQYAQAIPSFGSERMGAPVVAYCRIDDRPIRTHDPVSSVDCLVIQDPTLVPDPTIFSGLHPESYVLINTERHIDDLALGAHLAELKPDRMVTVPATEVALRQIGRPVPNTGLLGALSALTSVVPASAVFAAIRRRFDGALADANLAAATEAARYVRAEQKGRSLR